MVEIAIEESISLTTHWDCVRRFAAVGIININGTQTCYAF